MYHHTNTFTFHAGEHAAHSICTYICHAGFAAQLCVSPWDGIAAAALCVPECHAHGDAWLPTRTAAHTPQYLPACALCANTPLVLCNHPHPEYGMKHSATPTLSLMSVWGCVSHNACVWEHDTGMSHFPHTHAIFISFSTMARCGMGVFLGCRKCVEIN